MGSRHYPIWFILGVSFQDWVDFKWNCARQNLKGEEVLKRFIESQAQSYREYLKQKEKKDRPDKGTG